MSEIISWLDAFNRKERFFLLEQALGGFGIDDFFREELSKAIEYPIPQNNRAWMDYHLDWVYASIQLADVYALDPDAANRVFLTPDFRLPDGIDSVGVNATQEDIDLLVAFQDETGTHLIFVEAKGASSWGNRQFKSKINRLGVIFNPSASWARPDVTPHFVLASPHRPQKLLMEDWFPTWVLKDGKPRWFRLRTMPVSRAVMERWNPQTQKPDSRSGYWHLKQVPAVEAILDDPQGNKPS